MRIPPKIKITKRVSYEILWVQEFHDCQHTLGECRPEEKQIVLKVGQTTDELLKTLIHEIFHAMCFENRRLKLKHTDIYELEDPIFNLLKLNGLLK